MRIGIIGYKGRLGSELVELGGIPLICDITDQKSIESSIELADPDVIVNCAAISSVDACEEEGFQRAVEVNFKGPLLLREVFPGWLIHISTDYVFAGQRGPYKEDTGYPSPKFHKYLGKYALTKLCAEVGLLSVRGKETSIVRTTGLYGRSSHWDFVKCVYKNLSHGLRMPVTKELFGNQSYIPHVAEGIIWFIEHVQSVGIIHIASREVISRFQFARMIADTFELDKKLLIPVRNKDIDGWISPRPKRGGLHVGLAESLGVPIYSIQEGLGALKQWFLSNHSVLQSS